VLLVLGIWMALVAHTFDVATHTPGHGCLGNLGACNGIFHGTLSAQNQAGVISLLLFLVPCLFGIALGAPLVAGELQHHTNRLAWTQGISRSRWLIIKWLVVGLVAVVIVGLVQVFVQRWSGHVLVNFLETSEVQGSDRIRPHLFGITGIVPIAYTLFAFALGAAFGAIFRRTVWAVVGTIVGYGSAALLMVFSIRPYHLVPSYFLPDSATGSSPVLGGQPPWFLDYTYRFTPGVANPSGSSSASEIANRCSEQVSLSPQINSYVPFSQCLTAHNVESGTFYQPASHYWALQWEEAAIYVAAAFVLFGLTIWAVRRWRA
jgi:hypothetical protein